ncbi:MAG: Ni/Fe hydrogenase subunit gamma, partial [Isosphaeraceae bacterium]
MTAIAPMPSEPSVNPWLPKAVTIGDIQPEVPGIMTYQLDFADDLAAAAFSFRPGQFNMVYLPGIGEVPISISSDPTGAGPLLHTIRAAGSVTSALARKQVGESLGLRGPFGSSWPTGGSR